MNPTESQLLIEQSRIYRAPLDLVRKMWADPTHHTHWWGPTGFSTTTHSFDLREGGQWAFTMHGPDGTDYPGHIRFLQVAREQLVYEHFDNENRRWFVTTVEFVEKSPASTEMRFTMRFETNEQFRAASEVGAEAGLSGTMDRLAEHLLAVRARFAPFHLQVERVSPKELHFRRTFPAQPADVFAAITEAEHLKEWWGPYDEKIESFFTDPSVGGEWKAVTAGREGSQHEFSGRYLELDPPHRIVQSFIWGGAPDNGSTESMDLTSVGTATALRGQLAYDEAASLDIMSQDGMLDAMREAYERLDARLLTAFNNPNRLIIERLLSGTPEQVYRAWTEAEALEKWWGPVGSRVEVLELDVRRGGRFQYGLHFPGNGLMRAQFVFREVVPNERLVFVFSFIDEEGNATRAPFSESFPIETLDVYEFEPVDGKTLLRMSAVPLTLLESEMAFYVGMHGSMQEGFGMTLGQLEKFLVGGLA